MSVWCEERLKTSASGREKTTREQMLILHQLVSVTGQRCCEVNFFTLRKPFIDCIKMVYVENTLDHEICLHFFLSIISKLPLIQTRVLKKYFQTQTVPRWKKCRILGTSFPEILWTLTFEENSKNDWLLMS